MSGYETPKKVLQLVDQRLLTGRDTARNGTSLGTHRSVSSLRKEGRAVLKLT